MKCDWQIRNMGDHEARLKVGPIRRQSLRHWSTAAILAVSRCWLPFIPLRLSRLDLDGFVDSDT